MKLGNEDKRAQQLHFLREISCIPPKYVDLLKKQWVETAEEVLALSGLPDGGIRLKALLEVDDSGLSQFLGVLSTVVGEKVLEQLRQARLGGPLGAIITDEQKRKLGIS